MFRGSEVLRAKARAHFESVTHLWATKIKKFFEILILSLSFCKKFMFNAPQYSKKYFNFADRACAVGNFF